MSSIKLETTEMHTCGGPVRILTKGLPEVKGDTVCDKRNYIRDNLDHIRKMLLFEPRGHAEMFGAMLVPPENSDAAMGVVFCHNKNYPGMCGHATIALGRFAIEHGIVKNATSPETRVVLQYPYGPVETFVEYKNGKTGRVRFNSIPAFVYDLDFRVDIPGFGTVTLDIVFGGEFYSILPAARLGMDLEQTSITKLRDAATAIERAVLNSRELVHPELTDIEFPCSTLLTDGTDTFEAFDPDISKSFVVNGDGQVDRSPCGTGCTARIAQQFTRGLISLGQKRTFRGTSGGTMTAQATKRLTYGCYNNAVVVEVSGQGYFTGTCTFTLEEGDVIGKGFLLK